MAKFQSPNYHASRATRWRPVKGAMEIKSASQGSSDFVEAPGKHYVAQTELKPGTVGLTGAIMQNIALIAPAVAAFFFTQTLVGSAGAQAPLAYLIGFIIVQ